MRSTDHAAAVDFIERFLHTDLRLDRVAAGVGYSAHHLHRSFHRALGLTIHSYVRRRRLTEAARVLAATPDPVLDIAVDHGFADQQSFTHAFSSFYGLPPARWRRTRRFFPLLLPYTFDRAEWGFGRAADGFEVTDRIGADRLLPLSLAAVDMLPVLDLEQHTAALDTRSGSHRVLTAHRGGRPAAAMIIDPADGHIDYLAVHPLARGSSVVRTLLREAGVSHPRLSVTTFREGDRADLGHRRALLGLGFRPGPLSVEFGYPTQRFELVRSLPTDR
ncbi:AraC family transcriptional regulator [Nocardiopsis sp. NPDC006198]|uniref:AraC family transcriptional regulator n=1 Tax=Nocardiopsis sp. NPDC006198 TaxID=3154472 RepID=UPI0033A2738E